MYCLHSFTAHILHSLWSLFLKFYWRVLKGILDVVLRYSSTSHPNPTKQEEQSSQFPFLLGPSHQVFGNAHVSESSRGTTLYMLDLYDKHSLLQTLLVIFSLVTSFSPGIPYLEAVREHSFCRFQAFWGPNLGHSISQVNKLGRGKYLLKAIFAKYIISNLAGYFSSFYYHWSMGSFQFQSMHTDTQKIGILPFMLLPGNLLCKSWIYL